MLDGPRDDKMRQIHECLAEQLDFDVHATFADIRKRKALLGLSWVRRSKRGRVERAAAPDRDSAGCHHGR
jgi:hypothetical protein